MEQAVELHLDRCVRELAQRTQALNTAYRGPDLTGQLRLTNERWGHTTRVPGLVGNRFIRYAPFAPGLVVDIGAAYGVTTIPAAAEMKKMRIPKHFPNGQVMAFDIEKDHIVQIAAYIDDTDLFSRIKAYEGEFPKLSLKRQSVGALMLGSVLHYFYSIRRFRQSLRISMEWLAEDGKIFIEAQTPYAFKLAKPQFYTEYLRRTELGDPFPGRISSVKEVAANRSELHRLNLLDPEILRRELEIAGYVDIDTFYFAREVYSNDITGDEDIQQVRLRKHFSKNPSYAMPFESVGAIARKPKWWERSVERGIDSAEVWRGIEREAGVVNVEVEP